MKSTKSIGVPTSWRGCSFLLARKSIGKTVTNVLFAGRKSADLLPQTLELVSVSYLHGLLAATRAFPMPFANHRSHLLLEYYQSRPKLQPYNFSPAPIIHDPQLKQLLDRRSKSDDHDDEDDDFTRKIDGFPSADSIGPRFGFWRRPAAIGEPMGKLHPSCPSERSVMIEP